MRQRLGFWATQFAVVTALSLLAACTGGSDEPAPPSPAATPAVTAEAATPTATTEVAATRTETLPPPDLVPERHGPFLLVPDGWTGPIENADPVPFHPYDASRYPAEPTDQDIRNSTLWRLPSFTPKGFTLDSIETDGIEFSVRQRWTRPDERDLGYTVNIDLLWWRPAVLPIRIGTWGGPDANIFTSTTIDGNPAVLWHPSDDNVDDGGITSVTVWVFDERAGIVYTAQSYGRVTVDDLRNMVSSLYNE